MADSMYGWLLLAAVASIATNVVLIAAGADSDWPKFAVFFAVLLLGFARVRRTSDGSSGSGESER